MQRYEIGIIDEVKTVWYTTQVTHEQSRVSK